MLIDRRSYDGSELDYPMGRRTAEKLTVYVCAGESGGILREWSDIRI